MLILAAGGIAWSCEPFFHDPDPPTEIPGLSENAAVQFLAIGDTGKANFVQQEVARAMSRSAQDQPVDFVLMLGDNFYNHGVKSVRDPKWKVAFEDVYNLPGLNVPFYAVLGNHDHQGNIQAQIDYSVHSERWRMPARYYSVTRQIDTDHHVLIVGLDTNQLLNYSPGQVAQYQWLRWTLEHHPADWVIVIGHHPLYGSDTEQDLKPLAEVLQAFDVDVYMSGHEHNLTILQADGLPLQITSGAGGEPRRYDWTKPPLFTSASPGFAQLKVTPTSLTTRLFDAEDVLLFEHQIEKPLGQAQH